MIYRLELTKTAKKDLARLKSATRSTKQRLEDILKEIASKPYTGIGNPEQLKYDLGDYWSRELTKKDRIVYQVDESNGSIIVFQLLGHYTDK